MNIAARLVDSAVVLARAPCSVKCSVVTNVTAAGSGPALSPLPGSVPPLLVVSPASVGSQAAIIAGSQEGTARQPTLLPWANLPGDDSDQPDQMVASAGFSEFVITRWDVRKSDG